MITGIAPTGSSTPPICAAAEMWQLRAHLRAASDQRVRIDHGAVADIGADIDVHRRHAGDALAR